MKLEKTEFRNDEGGVKSSLCLLMLYCNFALGWQNAILFLTLPWVVEGVGRGISEVGWVLATAGLSVGVGAVVSGVVSDMWGRGRLLAFSLLVLCLVFVLHAVITDFGSLIVLRACAGFATGISVGIPGTIVSDVMGGDELRKSIGSSIIGYVLGQTIATPLGLLIVYYVGYQPMFLFLGIFLAVLFVSVVVRMKRIFECQIIVKRSLQTFKTSLVTDLRTFQLSYLVWIYLLSFAGSSLFYSFFPTWLKFDLDYSLYEFSGLYFSGGCLQIMVVLISRTRMVRISAKSLILLSLLGQSGLIVALYWFDGTSVATCLFFSVSMAALSLRILPLQLYVLNRGNPSMKGIRMGIVNTLSQLGKSIGGIVTGILLAGGTPSFLVLLSSAMLLLGSAVLVRAFMAFEVKLEPGS